MRAAFLTAKGRIEMRTMDIPSFADDEVLIRVRAEGVCGSDVQLFSKGAIGDFQVQFPYLLGHEAAGEVVATGKDVQSLHEGDRVTMEPGVPCGRCDQCRAGRYNLCNEMSFWAAPPVPGVLCEYVAHKAGFCFKVPQSVSWEVASLAEPLSVGVYAAKRAQVSPGKTVAILGMGPIGQLALRAALRFGADTVLASDVVDNRLELAKQMGAAEAVNRAQGDIMESCRRLTANRGFDVIIETSGAPQSLTDATDMARKGGTIVLIGSMEKLPANFPIIHVIHRELTVLGSYRYRNMYPTSVGILERDNKVGGLISHRFDFDHTQDAFEMARDHKDECMKVVIDL